MQKIKLFLFFRDRNYSRKRLFKIKNFNFVAFVLVVLFFSKSKFCAEFELRKCRKIPMPKNKNTKNADFSLSKRKFRIKNPTKNPTIPKTNMVTAPQKGKSNLSWNEIPNPKLMAQISKGCLFILVS